MKLHQFTFTKLFNLISVLFLLAACAPNNSSAIDLGTAAQGTTLPVVATFSILGDLVANVGGDKVSVTTLVGPGGDAHTFEPTPADSVKLVDAALIFENGLGFEPWLEDLTRAAQSQAKRVVVSDGIEAHAMQEAGAAHAAEADEHDHGEFDPHIWYDVANALHMVEAIRDALIAADAVNAAIYQSNAESYLAQLRQLDAWIETEVAKLPEDRRKLVTSHDTFGYFAHRYGFAVVGSALASVSTEVADPAAADIVALVEAIKTTGVPVIFAENVANPRLMQQIADEAGVILAPALYTDALSDPSSAGDSYIKMMRYNVTTMVEALAK